MKKRLRSALLAGLVLAAAPYTMAATKYWSGTGTWDASSTNWGTSPGGPYNTTFIAGDDAVFEGTAGTVTVSSPNNPNSITFNVTGYTLSSGTVTFNADPCTITTGTGISATISSVLAGASRGLTKAGAGTLALSGANTYTGVTNVNAGILNIQNNTALGTTANGTVVAFGARLQLQNNVTVTGESLTQTGKVSATGGTVINYTQNGVNYRSHTFTSSGALTVSTGGNVEYLVVAGGGGGGGGSSSSGAGAGGGAGGYRSSVAGESSGGGASAEPPITLTPSSYSIVVGDGGTAVTGDVVGNNGSNSSAFGITSIGGGGGARFTGAGNSGGSGGGNSSSGIPAAAGTTGQGFAGGTQTVNNNGDVGASGGGAGAVGGNRTGNTNTLPNPGGAGVTSSITGTATPRAGGGGGGIYNPISPGAAGGSGGGGSGGFGDTVPNSGTANTGSGGGGAGRSVSGAGGSGIVIVRYVNDNTAEALENVSGVNSWTGTVTLAADNTIKTTSGTLNVSGVISGAYALTKTGTGALTLSGTNTYTGITTVNTGILNIQNSSALGTTASGTVVAAGAKLQLQNGITVSGEALTLNGQVAATGGTVLDYTQNGVNYRSHTFTSGGTLNVTAGGAVDVLVVAGGGGGGGYGGGGGAGGVIKQSTTLTTGSKTVTVGSGGAGAVGNTDGSDGGESSFSGLAAGGGGGGGKTDTKGRAGVNATTVGGSAGGSGRGTAQTAASAGSPAGNNSTTFSNASGANPSSGWMSGSGGGGAGAVGYDGAPDDIEHTGTAAEGGIGITSDITGSSQYYGGGGGGAWQTGFDRPDGGLGGGGSGATNGLSSAVSGTANTGGGGGGGWGSGGGNGGSGIVIVRYINNSDNSEALENVSGNNTWTGTVTLAGDKTINTTSGTLTVSGVTSGAYALTKTGTGALTLSGTNTYTGITTVNTGILNIQNSSALGTTASGTVVAAGAKLQLQNGITVSGEALTLNGQVAATGGTVTDITVSGINYRVHTFTSDGNFVVTNGGAVEYLVVGGGGGGGSSQSGWPGGGGGGGGFLTGNTTIGATTHSITVGAGGPSQNNTTSQNGGNSSALGFTAIGGGRGGWNQNNTAGKAPGIGGSGGGGGGGFPAPTGAAGTSGQGSAGGNGGSYSAGGGGGAGGVGSNMSALDKGGSGGAGLTSSISGVSTGYAGGGGGGSDGGANSGASDGGGAGTSTTGVNGTANRGGGGGGAGQGTVAGGTGGSGIVIVRYINNSDNSEALENVSGNNTWTGTVTLAGDKTINTTSGTLNVSGVTSGAYALTKTGSGTLAFSGANNYSGATNVSAGTLIINGNNSGATGTVTVSAGATLAGTGTVGGQTPISGIHSPGNSPGIQTFTGNLSYNSGAIINWELYGNTDSLANRGTATGWDGVNVGGGLSFSSTAFNLDFGTTALGSSHDWSNALWSANRRWLVFSGATSLSGLPTLNLANWQDAQGDLLSSIGGVFSLSAEGNDVYLNFTAPPTVTSISPTSGSTAGGTSVTITGTNFTGATGVTIGGTAATSVSVVSATTITCVTPARSAGTASVLVTTPGGTNAANTLYTYVAPPTVTSISPTSGITAGGTSVTITGTNFTGATGVTIGGTAATSVNVVNATTITCTTPAGTAGTASVLVTTVGGTNAANTLYTYVAPPTVTSISPTSGSTAGGTSVTITGTNFTGATGVTIGGTAATSVSVVNATTITCTTPAGTAGTASVLVTTVGGTNVANTLYTYVAPPTVTAASNNLTTTTTTLTITGTNFSTTPGENTVVFTPAGTGTVTASTATSLTVTGLSGLELGALNAVVTTNGLSSGAAVQVRTVVVSGPGDLDAFNPDVSGGGGQVYATAVLPDGRMIIGGNFTTVGGVSRTNIARLNADGSVDATFTASTNNFVTSVAVQADGKLVIGGGFTSVNGSTVNSTTGVNMIARLNADGTLDTGFNAGLGGANSNVNSVAVQADGKLVLGGLFTSVNGSTVNTATGVNRIARLNADGTLDTGFNAGLGGANNNVNSVAVQADGKLVLGGTFTSVNGSAVSATTGVNRIARLNADGTLDTAFNAGLGGANNAVWSVAVQADGKLVLGGLFTSVNGSEVNTATGVNRIARLNADGTLDTGFNAGLGGADADVTSVAVQADGQVLLGGLFASVNGTTRNRMARLTNDAATQSLSAPDSTQVLWTRGGAGPELSAVTFEQSTDGGSSWTLLGAGTRVGSTASWQLTGLSLPSSVQVRARGRTTNGLRNGGSGLIEQVASFSDLLPPAPTVTSISPTSGSTLGGTSVTITGTHLTGATGVTIGGAAATDVVVTNATTLTCVTPAGSAGTASVLVTTASGTNAANTLYTYVAPPTVTSISPASGSTAGGTSVTITGTNLNGATGVTIGGTAATSVSVVSATTITCTTPAGTAGTASVLVTTGGGPNAANTLYTYVAPPTVTSISPATGNTLGGTSVTITGTNLTGATSVTIGGAAAGSVVVNSATSITCTTPAGTAGTASVLVTTAGGTNVANTLYTYTLSNDASLANLVLTTATLNPGFSSGTTSYTSSVPNATVSVTVTPTVTQAAATVQVRVNGGAYSTVASTVPSAPLALLPGANPIDVRVTAQNGTTTLLYTVVVTRAGTIPVPSAVGDVVTANNAPDATGADSGSKFDVLRRGGYFSSDGQLVFPGYLLNASGPAISGVWKDNGTGLKLLALTGNTAPETGETLATYDVLPQTPAINDSGEVTFLASLAVGSGSPATTVATDTALWSEVGSAGLSILMRESDSVPTVAGATIGAFASGCFATAHTSATTGEAAFVITMKGATTDTAVLRASVSSTTTAVQVVARENANTGVGSEKFGNLAGGYTDALRMDATGNLAFVALTKPSARESLWYQPVTPSGSAATKVFMAGTAATGDTAPGTGGATFRNIKSPTIGSGGVISFRGQLNSNGDNATNLKNDGIWRGTGSDASNYQCILRRGDDNTNRTGFGLPNGAKVGNLWGGWLTNGNRGAWRGWLDVNGNGVSSAADGDVYAIYSDLSGVMKYVVRVGGEADAPGMPAGAKFASFDLPVVGGAEQMVFLGNVTGGGTTAANNAGIWRCAPDGGELTLVMRTGDVIATTQGSKTIRRVDFPASGQTDRRWEQPIMDSTGRVMVFVTFTDGATSQLILPQGAPRRE